VVLCVCLGYINFSDWAVGGPDESFWGSLLEEQILDKDDKQIGEVDFGRAWVCLPQSLIHFISAKAL
jgi:hypothetical protein